MANIMNNAGKNHMKPKGWKKVLSTKEDQLNATGCCIIDASPINLALTMKMKLLTNRNGTSNRFAFFSIKAA